MAQAPKSPPATWKTRMGILTLRFRPDPALNHCKRLGSDPVMGSAASLNLPASQIKLKHKTLKLERQNTKESSEM